MIELGQEVKCKVTGFRGIAIGRTEWVAECVRFCVQPKINKDGTMPEAQTIDEILLSVVGKGITKPEKKKKTGGPMPAPQRQPNPRR